MADQGRWFKLWVSCLSDPHLDNLSLEDFARWCRLGAFMKLHGTDGRLEIPPPAEGLCRLLGVADFSALIGVLKRLPSYVVTSETTATVTCPRWAYYQGDNSTERVRKFRKNETDKKRKDKKRKEEKDPTTPLHPPPSTNGFAEWPPEFFQVRKLIEEHPFLRTHRDWLCDLAWWQAEQERLSGAPKRLDELLSSAVAYCITKGYKPTSRVGLRSKLHNCMGFEAERSQRGGGGKGQQTSFQNVVNVLGKQRGGGQGGGSSSGGIPTPDD